MSSLKILIVDDEPDIRELIKLTVQHMGYIGIEAESVHHAKQCLGNRDIAICLTDMRLPDGSGLDLVQYIQQHYAEIPVAVITAFGSIESAIAALKLGAFDFVSKPVDIQILRKLITSAIKQISDNKPLMPVHPLLGKSAVITDLKRVVAKVAKSQAPVMILGESGTGKELVARLIHEESPRRDKPFIPVNCGAIPQDLMESEFFGYLKGSFTGAVMDKQGLFQAADGGTLFLDEVAELPLHMQVKLLRAIQEKSIRPLGQQKEVLVDVRIVSATHKDLTTLVKNNLFRQDLFYRIHVIELMIPPLRTHTEDIIPLANYFLQKTAVELNIPAPSLSHEAINALQHYHYPGNVRELENIIARAAAMCESTQIQINDLGLSASLNPDKLIQTSNDLVGHLGTTEREIIVKALEKHRWNKTKAAKELGLTLRTLRYRLEKFNIK